MRNLSRLLKVVSIIVFISYLFSCKSSQNITNSYTLDENRIVYWFNIYISFDKVKNTDIYSYDVKRLNSTPLKASAKEYDYLLWKNLSEGTKFAIGPFNTEEEATKGLLFYQIQNEPHELNNTYKSDKKVFWFVLKVKQRERSRSWDLERIPGAIASGTYSEFDAFLRDNLKTGVLTIGPFNTMPDAEEAKRIYRLH